MLLEEEEDWLFRRDAGEHLSDVVIVWIGQVEL